MAKKPKYVVRLVGVDDTLHNEIAAAISRSTGQTVISWGKILRTPEGFGITVMLTGASGWYTLVLQNDEIKFLGT